MCLIPHNLRADSSAAGPLSGRDAAEELAQVLLSSAHTPPGGKNRPTSGEQSWATSAMSIWFTQRDYFFSTLLVGEAQENCS